MRRLSDFTALPGRTPRFALLQTAVPQLVLMQTAFKLATLCVSVIAPVTILAQEPASAVANAPREIVSTATRPVVLVTDSLGRPMPYVSVSVGGGTTRITDTNGQLVLSAVDPDTVRLVVRKMGYTAFDAKVGRASPSDPFRVSLNTAAQSLKAMEVKGKRAKTPLELTGFYQRMLDVQRGAVIGEFFTPEQLDARSSGRFSSMLLTSRYIKFNNVSGKTVLLGRGIGANWASAQNCAMTIVLDGMRMDSDTKTGRTRDAGYVFIDDLVGGNEVMAVEIYPSAAAAPAALQPISGGGSCGLVAIWTGGRHR